MNSIFQHTQMGGMAMYDNNEYFTFHPDVPVPALLAPYYAHGTAQLLGDGTFTFVRKPQIRCQSRLIRKLPHGRLSETKDGAVQLTLKVYKDENVDTSLTIAKEAVEACNAIEESNSK